ncbi:MAG: SAM-dependent DNA methyltransferase [Deltaproteobacteria bacterium]|nr:SAM-dependent DNA methyltransferase [Deltaproteobacteria bacterium]
MAVATPSATAPPNARTFTSFREIADFLWQNAERLRGTYKPNEYDKVILPMLVFRRMDCVLAPTKEKVLARLADLKARKMKESDPATEASLKRTARLRFFNTSRLDFAKLRADPDHVAQNLRAYLKAFSANARDVVEQFKFDEQITRLDEANLLYQVIDLFAGVNLHPDQVPNHQMGSVFEELIRKFNEKKNEEAGDHYTPRDIIRLMVDLLFDEDDDVLSKPGIVRSLFDPACGTGGMLSVAEEHLRDLNPDARLELFGQELNAETYAVCKSDMIIKEQNPDSIVRGNSFDSDGHASATFDYMLSNPPFGIDWKNVQKFVEDERDRLGFAGRFGPGLPRISDGALLFLLHMLSKMKPVDAKTREGGSRIAIVLNGSPLFTGDAGSGESEIRRWIIENDWLEAIVALPDQMFFNTGISTYVWVLTNRKPKRRRGKIQLINAVDLFSKMRKSLGNKRNELSAEHIEKIVRTYGDFAEGEISKIFDNDDFGFRRIVIERPLRLNFQASSERLDRLREESSFANLARSKKKGAQAERELEAGREYQEQILAALGTLDPAAGVRSRPAFDAAVRAAFEKAEVPLSAPVMKAILSALSERDESAEVCADASGNPEPDTDLRDNENVPLKEDILAYFDREVKPHVPDAWIAGVAIKRGKAEILDPDKVKVGYEIPITRHFYKYKPLRPLEEIESDIRKLEGEIQGLLGEVLR